MSYKPLFATAYGKATVKLLFPAEDLQVIVLFQILKTAIYNYDKYLHKLVSIIWFLGFNIQCDCSWTFGRSYLNS